MCTKEKPELSSKEQEHVAELKKSENENANVRLSDIRSAVNSLKDIYNNDEAVILVETIPVQTQKYVTNFDT